VFPPLNGNCTPTFLIEDNDTFFLYKIEPDTLRLRKYDGLPNVGAHTLLISLDTSEDEKYENALQVVVSLAGDEDEADVSPKKDFKGKKQRQAETEHVVRVLKFDVKCK